MSTPKIRTPTIVAYLGHPSSFAHEAAERLVKRNDLHNVLFIPCHSIKEVFDYVFIGGCYGVVPVHNTIAGVVDDFIKASRRRPYRVIDQMAMHITHNLLKHPKGDLSKSNRVVSHGHALTQCTVFLDEHFPKLKRVKYASTSTAARDLSEGRLGKNNLVIASARAATHYKLDIVAKNIQNKRKNNTLFQLLNIDTSTLKG